MKRDMYGDTDLIKTRFCSEIDTEIEGFYDYIKLPFAKPGQPRAGNHEVLVYPKGFPRFKLRLDLSALLASLGLDQGQGGHSQGAAPRSAPTPAAPKATGTQPPPPAGVPNPAALPDSVPADARVLQKGESKLQPHVTGGLAALKSIMSLPAGERQKAVELLQRGLAKAEEAIAGTVPAATAPAPGTPAKQGHH